jgi:hypothetical protein
MPLNNEDLETGKWYLIEPVALTDGTTLADLTSSDEVRMLIKQRERLAAGSYAVSGEVAIGPVAQVIPHCIGNSDQITMIGFYEHREDPKA